MSIFSQIKVRKPKSSTFDLSHQKKLSGNMGKIIPIMCMDTVPGDQIKINTAQLLRMAPMIAPIFHKVTVYQHFFFVPNRLIYQNWEPFITGGEDGYDTSVPPTIDLPNNLAVGSVADYFGIPTDLASTTTVSALPFAAYGTIYNEYYRDENLITPGDFYLGDGSQAINSSVYKIAVGTPKARAWQHDYFTSALPWTQKGPEATIPLGGAAPILGSASLSGTIDQPPYGFMKVKRQSNGNNAPNVGINSDNNSNVAISTGGTVGDELFFDLSNSHVADLSQANAATINDLRSAFRLQEWLEKNARGGSRYIESILAHFGVRSSDARLQRPEFLGGGSVPIQVSEVLQTSGSDISGQTTPQGNMAVHGIAVGQNSQISYYCEEHGWIIGVMSVMPKTAYQQGVHKMFLRNDRFDYFWPEFAHLGEQAIQNKELYLGPGTTDPDGTFGYIPRYAEYKYLNDTVHGELKDSLKFWHLGRIFASPPALNADFVECNPSDRIFAVQDREHFYAIVNNSVLAKRPMPYFGTPMF
jgi:hypothetical protein